MNSFQFQVFTSVLLFTMTISMVNIFVEAIPKDSKTANNYTQSMSMSVDGAGETDSITPHGSNSTMLRTVEGKQLVCWQCSSPCSAFACCNDGYPQCCVVEGRCRCCRG